MKPHPPNLQQIEVYEIGTNEHIATRQGEHRTTRERVRKLPFKFILTKGTVMSGILRAAAHMVIYIIM